MVLWNTSSMILVESCSHCLTGWNFISSGSGVARRNHGLAGDVMPAIIPAPSVFTARVPVESRIWLNLRSPLFLSVVMNRPLYGRRKRESSCHCVTQPDRSDFKAFQRCRYLSRPCSFITRPKVCGGEYSPQARPQDQAIPSHKTRRSSQSWETPFQPLDALSAVPGQGLVPELELELELGAGYTATALVEAAQAQARAPELELEPVRAQGLGQALGRGRGLELVPELEQLQADLSQHSPGQYRTNLAMSNTYHSPSSVLRLVSFSVSLTPCEPVRKVSAGVAAIPVLIAVLSVGFRSSCGVGTLASCGGGSGLVGSGTGVLGALGRLPLLIAIAPRPATAPTIADTGSHISSPSITSMGRCYRSIQDVCTLTVLSTDRDGVAWACWQVRQ